MGTHGMSGTWHNLPHTLHARFCQICQGGQKGHLQLQACLALCIPPSCRQKPGQVLDNLLCTMPDVRRHGACNSEALRSEPNQAGAVF